MPTEKEQNRDIHIKRLLNEIRRTYGFDGLTLLAFAHTDDNKKMDVFTQGHVPPMDDTIFAMVRLVATTSYGIGKQEALDEFDKKMSSNLDSGDIDPALKL